MWVGGRPLHIWSKLVLFIVFDRLFNKLIYDSFYTGWDYHFLSDEHDQMDLAYKSIIIMVN